jgi:16S rRNA (uracil1498-N3)-methyltransferase
VKLKVALNVETGVRLLLNENEQAKKIYDVLSEKPQEVAIAVGPEGGWADEELAQFDAAGWQSVTLGSRILRAETAAIAAMAAVGLLLD